jgi:hypothetical protein
MRRYLLLWSLVACGPSTDPAPAGAPGSARPGEPAAPAGSPPTASAPAGLSDAELLALPLDACAVVDASAVAKHLGITASPKPGAKRDIKSSAGALLLRDAGCAYEPSRVAAMQLNVFVQLYRSADEAATKLSINRAPGGLALAGLGDEATTVDETQLPKPPRSVVIYVRAKRTNYTFTASSLDPFDYKATREALTALIDEAL